MTPSVTSSTMVAPPVVSPRELDRKVVQSVTWQAGKVVAQLASYVVLARLVVPAEYGKFALAVPLFSVLAVINDGGLSTAAVTGRHYDARLASGLAWTQLALGGAAALVMAALAPVLAHAFAVRELVPIGLWLAVSLLVGACALQPKAALRREMRVGALVLVDLAGVLSGVAAAWLASQHTRGVELLVVFQLVSVVVSTLVAVGLAPVPLRRFARSPELSRALGVGRHIVTADLLNMLRVQCPALFIGFFVLVAEVGLFNRANQLLHLPLAVLGPALANFLLPLLARSRDRAAEFRSHVQRTMRLLLAVAVPASVWIAVGPADLIGLVLGDAWRPVVPVLRNLSPLFASQVVSTVAMIALLGTERARIVRFFSFCNLAITVLAVGGAAPFGIGAVALALSVSGLGLRAPLLLYLAVREKAMTPAEVFEGLRLIAGLAIVSGMAVGLCRLLPLSGLAIDVCGLAATAGVSGSVLAVAARRMPAVAGGRA